MQTRVVCRKHGFGTPSVFVPACAVAMSAMVACAGTDEELAEYRRIDGRLEAIARFEALQETCRANGGVMKIDARGSRLPSRTSEIRSARCAQFR